MALDDWLVRLKTQAEAGYWQFDAPAVDSDEEPVPLEPFPWMNKSCGDCPFFHNAICTVHAEYRARNNHTCSYFDPANHAAAQNIIQERQFSGFRKWWDWFNGQGAA